MFSDKRIYRQQFIWFYFSLIAIAIFNFLLHISTSSINYLPTLTVGIAFWLLCIAAGFLSFWFVSTTSLNKLRETITLFFIINALVTILQLLFIMWDSGSINPYTYQGMYQKYFINTGDKITGIAFDVSTTNAILNAFGVIYFLYSRKLYFTLPCMVTMLLTTSNLTTITLAFILIITFIFKSTGEQKSIIAVCLLLIIVFMTRISPQNNTYISEKYSDILGRKKSSTALLHVNNTSANKPDSLLKSRERKQKIAQLFIDSLRQKKAELFLTGSLPLTALTKPSLPIPDIHSAPFQRRRDTTASQKKLSLFALQYIHSIDSGGILYSQKKIPGKIKALQQTLLYFKQHPLTIITGTGPGNFSSKLAFRATGLQVAGGYPPHFTYINQDFLYNHLSLYLFYFSKGAEVHSLIHSPNSVYDQLISEYGLLGLFSFVVLYTLYFLRNPGKLTYALPALLLMLVALSVDYWFEQLSIIILFELLMLLNIKEMQQKNE